MCHYLYWLLIVSKKIVPIKWQLLARIFEADGFKYDRQKGSHRSYTKKGVARPIVIPKYDEVGLNVIKANMDTAGMNRDRYFELMKKVK